MYINYYLAALHFLNSQYTTDSVALHTCICFKHACSLYGVVGIFFGCFVRIVILKVFPSGPESFLKHKVIMEYPTLKRINTILINCF